MNWMSSVSEGGEAAHAGWSLLMNSLPDSFKKPFLWDLPPFSMSM